MNKNTWEKDYTQLGGGLSKLAAEDVKRKGYTFKSKAQKKKDKEAKR